ncbi:MAG: hypothetical protein L7U72_07330, partial [Rubripirellula sp.]|nr:hypothetical protein [Rubripirellula sp.]
MRPIALLTCLAWFILSHTSLTRATDLDDVTKMINSGKYEEAEVFAAEQVERGIWNERWPKTLIR